MQVQMRSWNIKSLHVMIVKMNYMTLPTKYNTIGVVIEVEIDRGRKKNRRKVKSMEGGKRNHYFVSFVAGPTWSSSRNNFSTVVTSCSAIDMLYVARGSVIFFFPLDLDGGKSEIPKATLAFVRTCPKEAASTLKSNVSWMYSSRSTSSIVSTPNG